MIACEAIKCRCGCGLEVPPGRRFYFSKSCENRYRSRQAYYKNPKKSNAKRWARAKKNSKNLKLSRKVFYSNHIGKTREHTTIVKIYGTSKVSADTKKLLAFIRIGKRITNFTPQISPVNKQDLLKIIERIENGETFAAYE
jgi:hypothetical protein